MSSIRFLLPLLVGIALISSACGGGEEPTATPAPLVATATTQALEATELPTATDTPEPFPTPYPTLAPVEEVNPAQAESPLGQPDSPLGQPESPLPPTSMGIPIPLGDMATIQQLAQEWKAPAPESGKASISGLVYSPGVKTVIPGTPIYLTPAVKDGDVYYIPTLFSGPKKEHGDVVGVTDASGRFAFTNVPAGVYYLATNAPYDWILAFESVEAASPLQIVVEEGDQLDLGLLYVPWP
jgi:hypothetical protein